MPEVAATAAPVLEDRCSGVGRRAGQHSGDTLGVLVVARSGDRPARRHIGGLESAERPRAPQVQPDVDEFDPSAIGQRVYGFEPAEGDGDGRAHVRAVLGAGVHIDSAGHVDGDDGCGVALEDRRGVRTQPAPAGDADDAVDHQIRCRRDVLHHPAARLAERGQRRRMGAFRREQHRGGVHAAPAQEGRRPQGVTAVVPRSRPPRRPAGR